MTIMIFVMIGALIVTQIGHGQHEGMIERRLMILALFLYYFFRSYERGDLISPRRVEGHSLSPHTVRWWRRRKRWGSCSTRAAVVRMVRG